MIKELSDSLAESIEAHEHLASLAPTEFLHGKHLGAAEAMRDVLQYVNECTVGIPAVRKIGVH